MKKRLKKKSRRVLIKILLILFIALLFFYLIGCLQHQGEQINFLLKQSVEYQKNIDKLSLDNARLEKAFAYQYDKVEALQSQPQPQAIEIHKEHVVQEESNLDVKKIIEPATFTTTVVVGLLAVGKAIMSLTPALP